MGKITDYENVSALRVNDVFLLDGDIGTKTIQAVDLAKRLVELLGSQAFISGVDLSELDRVDVLSSGDKILVGTADGNKAINADDALFAMLDAYIPAEQRRMIFRGKNLGSVFTPEQKANIVNGTFKGFFLGDYWLIGSTTWRIVDFNYWLNSGDTSFTSNHLVIMPDAQLYTAQMNSTNITTGGYVGSEMYTANLANAKTLASAAFGSAVLTHREYLTNAVTSGYPSGGAWFDSTVELPNEIMMYGSYVMTPGSTGTITPARYTINKTQLALMTVVPKFINPHRQNIWLRDVVTAAYFALVGGGGHANSAGASAAAGVRPVFPVG